MGGQPMFILNEDSERTRGEDAQSSNITAGKAVSEAVRTTLGPRGMDKMLVSDGDVVITNDGATILDEMDIEQPAAQMLVEVAETQEEEVGDGTTTAAILAGELLSKAETLLEDDVHPTTIVEGYHEAAELAREAIENETIETELSEEQLISVAESSMTGKGTGGVTAEDLAQTVVDAIEYVRTDDGIDRDNITIHTQVGSSSSATELIEGVIVDEERASEEMPHAVEDASIAIIDDDFEIKESNIDAEYQVSNVDQLNAALDAETDQLREYADTLAEVGADVAFVTGDVDDRVVAFLADEGILAFEGISSDDAASIAAATGATRVGSVDTLESEDFGQADSISVESFGENELTFIEGGAAAEAVTVFARGGTDHVVDELERALSDSLDVVTAALDAGGVVYGAGATEIAMANYVRDKTATIDGRRQLAAEAFADALDVLPRTLAENTGMDPIDALVDLRSEHDAGNFAGIVAADEAGIIADPAEHGILDPAAVKREAIGSATESATMIVRIDDVIASN